MQNYYTMLNISPTASEEEIKKALHEKLRNWTTRTNAADINRRQEAERMVKNIEEAEKILLNASSKAEYDRKLKTASTPEREMGDKEVAGQENLIELGRKLLTDGDIPDAIYVANKATEKEPNNSEAWALSAQAKFRWGDAEDSIYEYKRAIKLRPNESTYYFDLGCVYESVERLGDALQNYERAAQVDPSVTMYRAAAGVLLVKNDAYDKGIEILKKCVQEEPNNPSYQWFMAIAYADSAHLGWNFVGADHPLLEPGYYATSVEHITTAQQSLEKAMALKFDDSELSGKLQAVKQDIDRMLSRKFTGSWASGIVAIIAGIFMMSQGAEGAGGGFFFALIGALYLVSARTPIYKMNSRLVQGKLYHELGGFGGAGDNPVAWIIRFFIIMIVLPFVTLYNFIRNYAMK